MRVWNTLRILAFTLVAISPIVTMSGCGGGAKDGGPGAKLAPQEDPSLNPESDSTMKGGASPTDPAIPQ